MEIPRSAIDQGILLERAAIGTLTTDRCGAVKHANGHALRLFDYSLAELIGTRASRLIPALDHESPCNSAPEDHAERTAAGARQFRGILCFTRFRTAFRADVIVCANATPHDQETLFLIADPYSNHASGASEREHIEHLHIALDAAGIGIWEWHLPTDRVTWDSNVFDAYGVTPTRDGLIEYNLWRSCVHPADLPIQEQCLRECIEQAVTRSNRFRIIRHDDGQERLIEAVTTPRRGGNGKIEWIIGSNRDITELRRGQEAASLIASIVSNSDAAIVGKTLDGTITSWNAGATQLFGYSANEAIGQNITILLPVDRSHEEAAIVASIRQGVHVRSFDTIRRTKDGRLVDVAISISPIMDSTGELVGASNIAMNIAERRAAERLAAQKTAELVRSNQELERFAYIASHDLQEPLRMVASFVELLAKRCSDKLDEKGLTYIGFAVDGAKRMQRLIDDLLAYSRVVRSSAYTECVDLQEILDTTLANLSVLIDESHARIEFESLPGILGNRVQLLQLFQNLIGNALKYRSARDPHVWIRARMAPDDSTHWLISIEDNGIGIDSAHFEKIFGIFQRLHSRAEYSGTGIGLAICKRVVENHGGRIWVESVTGIGTCMNFTLSSAQRE